jgi:hypothetical protein
MADRDDGAEDERYDAERAGDNQQKEQERSNGTTALLVRSCES